MKTPDFLTPGSTIGFTSTARKISRKELAPAIRMVEDWGYKVRLADCIGEEDHQFSGTDEQRAQSFQAFLDDPEIDAILCTRGRIRNRPDHGSPGLESLYKKA